MVVKFRTRKISRGMWKLAQILTLIIIIKKEIEIEKLAMPFSFFTGQYWKVHYRRPTRNIELQAGWRRKHHQYSDLYFVCIWKEKKKTRNLHLKLGIYFSITRSWYTYVFKIHWKVRFQIIGVFCATRKNQHVLETRRRGSQLVMAASFLLIYQFFVYCIFYL
jgi:hypothetical protein